MWLADTSVCIDHFKRSNQVFAARLSEGLIMIHPFVTGELACGNLRNRDHVLSDLAVLPTATEAWNPEVLRLVEDRRLWGRGLGWTDAHLLASALISRCRLWTLDKGLAQIAAELGIA
jgi:predicted nucleic acid-binding protein